MVRDCHRLLCSPPSTLSTLKNLGCYQWCTLVMNQHEQHRGAKLLSKSHKKLQGVSPALCSRLRSRGTDCWKHLLKTPTAFGTTAEAGRKEGRKVKQERKSLIPNMDLNLFVVFPCVFFFFFLIWFLFKEAITYHVTTSTLLKCSQGPSNYFLNDGAVCICQVAQQCACLSVQPVVLYCLLLTIKSHKSGFSYLYSHTPQPCLTQKYMFHHYSFPPRLCHFVSPSSKGSHSPPVYLLLKVGGTAHCN